MKPEIELIRMPAENSQCRVIRQRALVSKNNGNYHGIPWDDLQHDWNFDCAIYTEGAVGYTIQYLALFVGEDKAGLHCYVIYDPDA
jgi:hypothetical protein